MKGMMDSKNRLAFEKGGLQVSVTFVYLVESVFHAFTGQRLLLRQYMLTSLVRCTVYVKLLEQWFAFYAAHL